MNDKGHAPKKMYLRMTPAAARALSTLAQAQTGELTDPRKVGWALIEEALLEHGMIAEMSWPPVEWPPKQEVE